MSADRVITSFFYTLLGIFLKIIRNPRLNLLQKNLHNDNFPWFFAELNPKLPTLGFVKPKDLCLQVACQTIIHCLFEIARAYMFPGAKI